MKNSLKNIVFCQTLLNIGLLINWLLWVTEKTIKLAADRYARFLLEAILNLEAEDGGNLFPKC